MTGKPTKPIVLIVDDNDANLLILKTFMSYYDCEILLAKDGRKAIQHFEKNDVHLVLMDVMMPEMDGFEATREIRRIETNEQSEETPIIAVTAHIHPSDQHQCINAGMNDYLAKPLKSKKLIETIRMWRPDMVFIPPAAKAASATA